MKTGLTARDVVEQVVPERAGQVEGVVWGSGVGVARAQHGGNIAIVVTHSSVGISSGECSLWLKRT